MESDTRWRVSWRGKRNGGKKKEEEIKEKKTASNLFDRGYKRPIKSV
jgi:hypothetical protein